MRMQCVEHGDYHTDIPGGLCVRCVDNRHTALMYAHHVECQKCGVTVSTRQWSAEFAGQPTEAMACARTRTPEAQRQRYQMWSDWIDVESDRMEGALA